MIRHYSCKLFPHKEGLGSSPTADARSPLQFSQLDPRRPSALGILPIPPEAQPVRKPSPQKASTALRASYLENHLFPSMFEKDRQTSCEGGRHDR